MEIAQVTNAVWFRNRLIPILAVFLPLISEAQTGKKVTEFGDARPSLENCSEALILSRSWTADFLITRVGGDVPEIELGITDGTSETSFPLERASHSYMACLLRSMGHEPDRSRGRPSELIGRFIVKSQNGESIPAKPPAVKVSSQKSKRDAQESRPIIDDCLMPLSSYRDWKIRVDAVFEKDAPYKLKSWSISSDLKATTAGGTALTGFVQCFGKVLLVPKTLEVK